MVDDLIRHKNHFWCHHCGWGLFFPLNCMDHADTEPFEEQQQAEEEEEE
jgi:hypothetical protein